MSIEDNFFEEWCFEIQEEELELQEVEQKSKNKETEMNNNIKELGFKSDEFRSLAWQEIAKIENNTDEICPSCGENIGWNCFDNTAQCYECKTISRKNENGVLVGDDVFKALGNILNPKGDK